MKILFISRATLFSSRGGDTVQMENTAKALRRLSINVDIELCNNLHINYKRYDLLHFFNIIRPGDIIFHIDKSKLPFVVSPIYLTYHELTKYSNNLKSIALSSFGKYEQEYIKCIARNIFNAEKIVSYKYLLLGHKNAIGYILKRCAYLLPNSQNEFDRLKNDFKYVGDHSIVPNAVDMNIFHEEKNINRKENTVLCVARIEPHKNQLNLIRALKNTNYNVTIAGAASRNHQGYLKECKKESSPNVAFINCPNQNDIVQLYNEHKIHVLPSWFETTGLSSLEAAACGCNIVISDKGDTRDYFSNVGYYCNPADLRSIKEAVDKAMNAPKNETFMQKIIDEYNWNVTALKTLKVYERILGK